MLLGLLPACVAAALTGLSVGVPAAGAAPEPCSTIECVWSFRGGEIAIQRASPTTFAGTVVAPTKFAECSHPVGEQIWSAITEQADSSYWGLHQWFYAGEGCIRNPTLGRTAWRVMAGSRGGHFLRVCFSSPGDPQPTIDADGTSASASFGCVDSALVAPLPVEVAPTSRAGVLRFDRSVSLPANTRCVSRRTFQIHLRDPRYDPFKEVVVALGSRKVTVKRRGNVFVSTIDLRGLPRGAFTVRIRAITVLGHHLAGSRTYHTCARPRRSDAPKSLRRGV